MADRSWTVQSQVAPARGGALGTLGVCALLLVWVVAFQPEPQWWGVVPGFIGALWLCERVASTGAFLRWSLLFGALGIGYGYRWLAPTVQLFGGVPAVPAYLLVALFGILGVANGWAFTYLYRSALARGHRPHPLTVAATWVACESFVPRLFPWMAGHGMVEVAPVRMAAEWGGVPGVSFVTLCLVAPLYEALRWALPMPGRPAARPLAALVCFAVGVAFTVHGVVRYGEVRATQRAASERLAVGIVQPNVGSVVKRKDENRKAGTGRLSAQAYTQGSERALAQGAELIVWPETAVTAGIAYRETHPATTNDTLGREGYDVLNRLGGGDASTEGAWFLIGAYEQKGDPTREPDERWNVAALRQRGDSRARWSTFRKVYLIPFGEAMPFGWFKDRLPQKFTMLAGEGRQALLELGTGSQRVKVLPFLCYEGILPDYVREAAAVDQPDVLVSMANDSWFGDSWEPGQHLNFTRFRAVEHGLPLVRSTNTGISAFIDATGDVDGRLGVGEVGELVRDVPLARRAERTIYARYGHRLPWLLAAWAVLAWIAARVSPAPVPRS